MKLTAQRVEEIFKDCMFENFEELQQDVTLAAGIRTKVAFKTVKIEEHAQEIGELLRELPDSFQESGGGGMSFLAACDDKHGQQWGEHMNMDELFMLGMAAGYVDCPMPRAMWRILPGGMPYYGVRTTPGPIARISPGTAEHDQLVESARQTHAEVQARRQSEQSQNFEQAAG